MLTMRPIEPDGTWGAKSKKQYILDESDERIRLKSGEYKSRKVSAVDWNEQSKAEEWRKGWADCVNAALQAENVAERVDHRSYERQGVDKIPSVHMGVAASQMEKKGVKTERGNLNREIEITNNQLRQLRARVRKCKDWVYAQPITNAPTMVDVMGAIADVKNMQTRWQQVRDLKAMAKAFNFLQENNLADMGQLVEKVTQMNEEFLRCVHQD